MHVITDPQSAFHQASAAPDLPLSVLSYLDKTFPGHTCCRIRRDRHQFDIEITYRSQTHWLVFNNAGKLIRNDSDTDEKRPHHDIDVWIEGHALPAVVMEYLTHHFPGSAISHAVATWSGGRVTKYKVVLLIGNHRHEMEFYGQWKL